MAKQVQYNIQRKINNAGLLLEKRFKFLVIFNTAQDPRHEINNKVKFKLCIADIAHELPRTGQLCCHDNREQ